MPHSQLFLLKSFQLILCSLSPWLSVQFWISHLYVSAMGLGIMKSTAWLDAWMKSIACRNFSLLDFDHSGCQNREHMRNETVHWNKYSGRLTSGRDQLSRGKVPLIRHLSTTWKLSASSPDRYNPGEGVPPSTCWMWWEVAPEPFWSFCGRKNYFCGFETFAVFRM